MTVKRESCVLNYGGKGASVTRKNPETGEVENICLCWHNADFSRGCIAQVHGTLLREVIENEGHYAEGNKKRYHRQGLTDQRCQMCYSYRNFGGVQQRMINEKTRASFEKYNPDVIRLAKIREVGHPFYYREFMKFLDLCEEFDSEIILPTKMLPFGLEGAKETYDVSGIKTVADYSESVGMVSGEDLAERLKAVGGTLLFSIGYDCAEPGCVTQGFSNEWRLEQARRYHEQGVNVSLTIVTDVVQSIEDNVKKGSFVRRAIDFCESNGVNYRFLPLRFPQTIKSKRLGVVKSQEGVLEGVKADKVRSYLDMDYYKKRGNKEKAPKTLHPDFGDFLDRGIGFCGSIGGTEYCDKCNICPEDPVRISFPVSQIVPVRYEKSNGWGGKGKGSKKTKGQMELF